MRLLADESVDFPIVALLRENAHDVIFVAELAPGISDAEVLHRAVEEKRLLIAADKDFGDLVFREKQPTEGVVLIRLAGLAPTEKATLVVQVFQEHAEDIIGAFTVITPRMVRIRRSKK